MLTHAEWVLVILNVDMMIGLLQLYYISVEYLLRHVSDTVLSGLYPLIGWKIGDECVFVAEGFASDTGRCLEWAKSIGQKAIYFETILHNVCNFAVPFFFGNKY